ncbi:nuclear transport factor 2 family protein [Haloparvum sedimenti]|uniref:nuclear transport factor 2 family protein n=1 Tax=Haloparvum sedimenti TaxID=1678448 RepID=UPI00071E9D66|nr:nuclear transport factor 2 family protein [Haloparvum sedimenti]
MTHGHDDPEAAVRAYYDHVDAEAYEDLFALFAEDVVYERPGQDAIEGMEAFREFYFEGRPLEDGRHEVHRVVADGDGLDGTTVAVRGTFSGVQDGETVSFGFADFHEFEDGLIARRDTYTDRDEV